MPVIKNLMVRAGADFSPITQQARRAQRSMEDMSRGVRTSCGTMSSAVRGLRRAFGALGIVISAAALVSFAKDARRAYDEACEAEAKLAQVMRNTMGASAAEIREIRKLTAAQQALGVIGDDVQQQGAQELATYLELTSSLKTLIPVMDDMLAQQYGLNATGENAANIATMLGKVMNGQTSALSRYGYAFTKAQEQILKFGTESERAAVLAEVVEESVGGMNRALAMTPSGRLKQVSDTLGDIKEQFGKAVTTILTVFLPVINAVATALAGVATIAGRVAQSIANVFGGKRTTTAATGYQGVAVSAERAAAGAGTLAAATDRAGRAAKKLSTVGFDTLQKLTVAAASGTDAATDEIEGAEVGGGGVLTGAEEGGAVEGYGALEAVLRRVKGLFEAIEPVVSRVRESIGRLGELLSGKMSFAEYFGNLTPVETVLWSIAAAVAAIAAVRVIGAVADLGRLVAQLPLWLQLASVWRLCHGEGWRLSSAMASVFGRTTQLFAGIGSLVGGAVLAVSNAFVMWRNGFSWLHETLMVLGIAIAAVGAVILGVPATVAAAVAGAVAAVATAVVLIHQHWDEVKSGALATLGQIKQGFSDTLTGIKQIFGGWWQVFVGLATGNVRKLGEGIKNIVKGVVNVVIGTINVLIAGLNATVAPIRALIVGIGRVTGKHYTLDSVRIPSIPRLATGAVMEANRPFAAILGDQTSGRNIETPERLLRQIYREESRGASSETVELLGELLRAVRAGKVLMVDRRVLGEVTARTMAERARGSGTEPVPIR